MKKCFHAKTLWAVFFALVSAAITGCCIQIGCGIPLAQYERVVQLSAPLPANGEFCAQTHNGSIVAAGGERTDCNLTATITARAGSESDAKKLAETTMIRLEQSANKLTARIDKPTTGLNQSVSVSLNVTVPKETSLAMITHNGNIDITGIDGAANATTHNGQITTSQLRGGARLRTHNGQIVCKDISGEIDLVTHNGSVRTAYSIGSSPVCSVSLTTHNGNIDFGCSPTLSAAVRLATHNGSIETELPITVTGKISKGKVTGTIGSGGGKLHLETYNGSIKIKSTAS